MYTKPGLMKQYTFLILINVIFLHLLSLFVSIDFELIENQLQFYSSIQFIKNFQ